MKLTLLLAALLATNVYAESIQGRVVGVSDGDTVALLTPDKTQVKIRLAQIDAPEKNQAFGQASKQSLSDMIFGKDVRVEVETKDKYGRTVGQIIYNGKDINLEQIKRGMAWFYVKYGSDQIYASSEAKAKAGRIGLWSEPGAIPPWEFRHGGKAVAQSTDRTATVVTGACGTKRFCKEMSSCEEAMMYLKQCGLNKLDRDGDGVPCESICR